ncbi:type II toxin-antitoxin system RelE/ParE family toxin [Flavobacterium sp. UBA6195]|uniref:type II toxin-antitoxin system RelE/ParE family toxin n=1 Tax=Flavobacterium sp. UBA6195 TaxID=1946554 RepID=UPI0011D4C522|nr:type II toxin-antitoxin system RelE/ParE family toxin [Flavobacterium sp. UBA6195]TXI69178.1 MAG: type II toxin-antitoxin system RelE/ParE family toxin [Flavobacterium sp.]
MIFSVIWTSKSFEDISNIHYYLSHKISLETANKIIDEIYQAPNTITFVEQFQMDEYRKDCRRIIVRNYKILYYIKDSEIFIIRIFNTFQNPIKSL